MKTLLRSLVLSPGVHRSNDGSTKFDESQPHTPDADMITNKENSANIRNVATMKLPLAAMALFWKSLKKIMNTVKFQASTPPVSKLRSPANRAGAVSRNNTKIQDGVHKHPPLGQKKAECSCA